MSGPVRYWTRERVLAAIRDWNRVHGEPPRRSDWVCATPQTPCVSTVSKLYGSWNAAIRAAGCTPRHSPLYWTRQKIAAAACQWAQQHGRRPLPSDWDPAPAGAPHMGTVYNRFGTWEAMLAAARLPDYSVRVVWTRDRIARAMLDHLAVTGHWPTLEDWKLASDGSRPVAATVVKAFGSWTEAKRYAGWNGQRRRRSFKNAPAVNLPVAQAGDTRARRRTPTAGALPTRAAA